MWYPILKIYHLSIFDGHRYHALSSVMISGSARQLCERLVDHISFDFPHARSIFKGNPLSCLHRISETILFATAPALFPHQMLRFEKTTKQAAQI